MRVAVGVEATRAEVTGAGMMAAETEVEMGAEPRVGVTAAEAAAGVTAVEVAAARMVVRTAHPTDESRRFATETVFQRPSPQMGKWRLKPLEPYFGSER